MGFRAGIPLGAACIETLGAILFLIPKTARLGAVIIVCFMCGVLLSHVFVLGYGTAFVIALLTTALPCVYLFLTPARLAIHFPVGQHALSCQFLKTNTPTRLLQAQAGQTSAECRYLISEARNK
jgi:hypothetical protein